MEGEQSNFEATVASSDELVIDGTHGANVEDITQPLILFRNRKMAVAKLNKRIKWLSLIVLIYSAGIFYYMPSLWFFAVALCAWYAFVYLAARRNHEKSTKPIMEFRPEGLVIHSMMTNFDLIPWAEIKEARAYRLSWFSMIGIVPTNLGRTLSHGSIFSQMLGWSNAMVIPFYRLGGQFIAPINIPQEYSPLSAEDVVEHINKRRAHALGLNTDDVALLP